MMPFVSMTIESAGGLDRMRSISNQFRLTMSLVSGFGGGHGFDIALFRTIGGRMCMAVSKSFFPEVEDDDFLLIGGTNFGLGSMVACGLWTLDNAYNLYRMMIEKCMLFVAYFGKWEWERNRTDGIVWCGYFHLICERVFITVLFLPRRRRRGSWFLCLSLRVL